MSNFVRRYRELTFEQKTVLKTIIGLCFSGVLACGKLAIGLLSDFGLVGIALCSFGIMLAKLECVLGAKRGRGSFMRHNLLSAGFLFAAGAVYVAFMCGGLLFPRAAKENTLGYVLVTAFISFCEFGFSIAGLMRAKDSGHFYRNIRIANFCAALVAILTTQVAILDMESVNAARINAYSGMGVGTFITLCALYIAVAPATSIIGRERRTFILVSQEKNRLLDMALPETEFALCKSFVYGDYIFRATVEENKADGRIVRGKSLWKRMHIVLKILCCILLEILLFVWLIGRGILFLRSIDLPRRLEKKMRENGFEPIDTEDGSEM